MRLRFQILRQLRRAAPALPARLQNGRHGRCERLLRAVQAACELCTASAARGPWARLCPGCAARSPRARLRRASTLSFLRTSACRGAGGGRGGSRRRRAWRHGPPRMLLPWSGPRAAGRRRAAWLGAPLACAQPRPVALLPLPTGHARATAGAAGRALVAHMQATTYVARTAGCGRGDGGGCGGVRQVCRCGPAAHCPPTAYRSSRLGGGGSSEVRAAEGRRWGHDGGGEPALRAALADTGRAVGGGQWAADSSAGLQRCSGRRGRACMGGGAAPLPRGGRALLHLGSALRAAARFLLFAFFFRAATAKYRPLTSRG
mmetsp:Transcript_20371/g.48214  ORF Transcript_20371/g.48214 Transcript_20371/m.48214 type:complete len:317 (+) Transcript_20371:1347-2297(+)